MKIKLFKPKNPILQTYIECFYTLERMADEPPVTYLGFPTTTVFVTLTQQVAKNIADENEIMYFKSNAKPQSWLYAMSEKAGSTRYEGKISEVTIYFKPLGLNAFLEQPLAHYSTALIAEFEPFEDYQNLLKNVFDTEGTSERIEILENYWLSKLRGFDHFFMHKAMAAIFDDTNFQPRVSRIAQKCKVSRMTFNKQFALHVGCNPNLFIKIVRFRHAIRQFSSKSDQNNLVDVAYLAEYFDQSHMAKDFKTLTGYTPKTFFARLSQLENGQINWLFL